MSTNQKARMSQKAKGGELDMGIYNSSNSMSEDKVPLLVCKGWPREDNAHLIQDAVGTVGLKDQH